MVPLEVNIERLRVAEQEVVPILSMGSGEVLGGLSNVAVGEDSLPKGVFGRYWRVLF